MSTPKILVVDDEASMLELISAYLRAEGYEVQTAADGPKALAAARLFQPDIIVLDIMLPGIDGLEVLSQLRRDSQVYVILLTAKAEETDKIIGLTVGADDYVTKPFSPRELVARIKAALRRLRAEAEETDRDLLSFAHVRIDVGGRRVWADDKPVELTGMEFELLRVLAEHRGMVLSRSQLLEQVWGHDYYGEERVVDVHIGHIRQKLGANHSIATVRGVGYRFEDEPL